MLYNSQRNIAAATARIDLSDASVYLKGSESQTVTIDGSGFALHLPARASESSTAAPMMQSSCQDRRRTSWEVRS
jgi:hypothetical protein